MIISHRGWVKPALRGTLAHFRLLWENRNYRTLQRLHREIGRYPRYREFTIRLWDSSWSGPDAASFLSAFDDIFVQEHYRFETHLPAPRILDCGANVGLSVIYFSQRFPMASINAFEADPRIYRYLTNNLSQVAANRAIQLHQSAVFTHSRGVGFHSEGADGGAIVSGKDELRVPSIRLADLLQDPCDFLKIDIEGVEVDVLLDCGQLLANVRNLFFEYHPNTATRPLGTALRLLEDIGFRFVIKSQYELRTPFASLARGDALPNLNVFCHRIS